MVMDSAQARRRIEATQDLPTLPTVIGRILDMANSPMTNAADIGRVIEQDQALTAKVLKLVNSAYYGFPGQIRSVQHAIVILGFNKVKTIALAASVFDLSKGRESNLLDLPSFWEHSLGTALAAKVVAHKLGTALQPEDAFVGGLIHDLGKLILALCMPKEYSSVFEWLAANPCTVRKAERELLGFDHAQVGDWIAEKWRLPMELRNAARLHHGPTQAREDREMVFCVHVGDVIARSLGIGSPGDMYMEEINLQSWQHFNLDVPFLDETVEQLVAELKRAGDFFDLIAQSR